MLSGFKTFILRGNVVDLAVGVVIGAAFGAVVAAFTKDLLMPLIAALVGKPDFSAITFTVGATVFPIGDFINAVVAFLLVVGAVYFFVVTPLYRMMARMNPPAPAALPATKACPQCLSQIPVAAARCAYCTQAV